MKTQPEDFKLQKRGLLILWIGFAITLLFDLLVFVFRLPFLKFATGGSFLAIYLPVQIILFVIAPIGLTILYKRWISKLLKTQIDNRAYVMSKASRTLVIRPPIDGKLSWRTMSAILSNWYKTLSELPNHTAKALRRGQGLPFSLGYSSIKGADVRLTARIPDPTCDPDYLKAEAARAKLEQQVEGQEQADDENAAEPQVIIDEETIRAAEYVPPVDIPLGLPSKFSAPISGYYRWCQIESLPAGKDLLDLSIQQETNPAYMQARQLIEMTGQPIVRGFAQLQLAKPSYFPIRTNPQAVDSDTSFNSDNSGSGTGSDPTAVFYDALNCESNNNLLACGIEIPICPPASFWLKKAETVQHNYWTKEMELNANSRYTKPTTTATNKKGASTSGAKQPVISAKQAARNKMAAEKIKAAKEAIEAKTKVTAAFPIGCIYVWAEGTKEVVIEKLEQLANILESQYNSEQNDIGNKFQVVQMFIGGDGSGKRTIEAEATAYDSDSEGVEESEEEGNQELPQAEAGYEELPEGEETGYLPEPEYEKSQV